MIIRLIDIVLIVLFGFIVISDIDVKGSIPLPSERQTQTAAPERKLAVYVEVDAKGEFTVFLPRGNRVTRSHPDALETLLLEMRGRIQREEGVGMAVIIRPHEMSPIQATVDVLDVCSKNNIPKNIARKSMALF